MKLADSNEPATMHVQHSLLNFCLITFFDALVGLEYRDSHVSVKYESAIPTPYH